jgi:hypothetical protein
MELRPVCLLERFEDTFFDLLDEFLFAGAGAKLEVSTCHDDVDGDDLPLDGADVGHVEYFAFLAQPLGLILDSLAENSNLGERVSPVIVEQKWNQDDLPDGGSKWAREGAEPWS